MRVLGIETSSVIGSVALLEEGRLLADRSFGEGMRHGRDLVPTIREFLGARGWKVADLGLVAVSRGPGSYTGLRIGAACAKALGYASGVPLVGVNSLDVAVRNAPPCPRAAVLLDARWRQVYARVYEPGADGGWTPVTETLVGAPDRVRERIPEGTLLLGDGAGKYPEVFAAPRYTLADAALATPRAEWVARLGEAEFHAGRRDDPMTFVPEYLRPTEAEVKWGLQPMPGI
jgi:tRNA threonylcarbamoyladenosine biosynthesis protein TsaB